MRGIRVSRESCPVDLPRNDSRWGAAVAGLPADVGPRVDQVVVVLASLPDPAPRDSSGPDLAPAAGRSLAQRRAEDLIALVQVFVWATFEDDVAFGIEDHGAPHVVRESGFQRARAARTYVRRAHAPAVIGAEWVLLVDTLLRAAGG